MASHFKFYSGVGETVPFNRRYQYPSQAHKTLKSTVKIPPKNGAVFASNGARLIRLEFPSQGYLNPLNTHIEFDLSLLASADASNTLVRFQNNIQCIFNRVRILYGSLVIEDINDYNTIVRMLSEHTQYNANVVDQSSIAEGVGGQTMLMLTANTPTMVNTRYNFIQGIAAGNSATAIAPALNPRRYQVNLAAGLFSQDKLIPLKWMASQLAIELYLEDPVSCLEYGVYSSTQNYELDQVNIVAEMLEFDSSYDAAFLNGLKGDGVPLKLCSWHTFTFATTTAANYNLQIQERSRSVKAAFMVQLPPQTFANNTDTKAMLMTSGTPATTNYCKNAQWRIGGRYYPSQQITGDTFNTTWNGGCEYYVELQKALNQVGDYNISSSANAVRWSQQTTAGSLAFPASTTTLVSSTNVGFGPQNFVIATDFETSDGSEISGLNAEEQSDIALILNYTAAQTAANPIKVFTYYDALLIVRDNNMVELIL